MDAGNNFYWDCATWFCLGKRWNFLVRSSMNTGAFRADIKPASLGKLPSCEDKGSSCHANCI